MDLDFDVVDLPATDHVDAGDRAPDFVRPLVGAEDWTDRALSDLTDQGPVLLVFHPMDGAFPTTYVWNELQERALDDHVTVVGCSISTPYEHAATIEARDLTCRLFSDPANGVAESYGVVHDLDGMHGVSEPRLATYVLDEDRRVEHAWVAQEHPEFPDYDELERAVERVGGG